GRPAVALGAGPRRPRGGAALGRRRAGGVGRGPRGAGRGRGPARRRVGRARGAGDQPRRVPLLRARVPRSRRAAGAAGAARRPRGVAGAIVPRISAESRLHRLLALVPWVAAHDGPTLADVSARFGCTEDELVDDLQLLFLCGLHPYTPDMLIDVDIAGG